jgi:hypothetical protein
MKVARVMFTLALAAVVVLPAAGCLPPSEPRLGGEARSASEHHRTEPDDATARCEQFGCSR